LTIDIRKNTNKTTKAKGISNPGQSDLAVLLFSKEALMPGFIQKTNKIANAPSSTFSQVDKGSISTSIKNKPYFITDWTAVLGGF
jgi:hypothetical protein